MTGLLSILAMATNEYVAVSDAAVALTVEALQASSRPFDSEISETLRPQKGQVASASSIRTLLEDSREVQTVAPVSKGKGKSKNKGGGQPDTDLLSAPQRELFGQSKTEQALTSSAQALGAARDALVASSRVLQIEVNAAGGAPLGVTQHPQPLLAAANDLHNALVTVVSGSVARCSLLSAGPSGNVAASEAGSTWGTVLDVQGALGELARRVSEISALVEAASNQLCEEIVLAEQILAKREAERAVRMLFPRMGTGGNGSARPTYCGGWISITAKINTHWCLVLACLTGCCSTQRGGEAAGSSSARSQSTWRWSEG